MKPQKFFLTKKDEKQTLTQVSKEVTTLPQQRKDAKSLLKQYERIVKEQRKVIHDLTHDIWKILYVFIYSKLNRKGGVR